MKKKIILGVSLFLMLLTLFALSICAAEPVKTWDVSASENDRVYAYLYEDVGNQGYFTLTISGRGDMKNGDSENPLGGAHWYNEYASLITEVIIENGVTSIGDNAFEFCSVATKVIIPDTVTRIGDYAFYWWYRLETIEIPNSVTSIGDYAFEGTRLTTLTIPNGVISVGDYAFSCCYSLTNVVIPESVKSIGNYAFYFCYELTSVDVDEQNSHYRSIDGNLYTEDLKTLIKYSGGKINTDFSIPQGVENITEYSFFGCGYLKSVTIPNSVINLGDYSFANCFALTKISIPESVINVGKCSFESCELLTIYAEVESQPSGWDSTWNPDNCPVVWGHTHMYEAGECVCGMTEYEEKWDISATENDSVYAYLYNDPQNEGYFTLIITGQGEMKNWTFYTNVPWYSSYRNKIKSLTIEDGIITIGNWAFSNLTALISVEIASGVEIIGEDAFSGCDSLTSIEIPDSVTLIGSGAFADCFLTSLIIPNSVMRIGEDAFFNCRKLTSLVIPSSVLDIGDYAFDYCENLTIYTEFESQPSGWCPYWNDTDCPVVWGIDDFGCTSKGLVWVFFNDENIAMITGQINAVGNIIIPEKINEYVVTNINNKAFYGNASLNKVVISNSVTTIGYSAFNSCDSLKSITIPSGVTSIDSLVFSGCTSLTIYAEATSQPSGWVSGWNPDNRPVVWGHTHTYEDYICVCGMEQSYIEKWDISATENDNVTATLYDDYSLVISGTGEMKNWTGSSSAPWHSLYSREIKSVTIEKGVINIGDYAFYWCIALERVVINDSVTRIGRGSFLVCAVLMSIEIPDSVTSIGEYAFDGCDALTSIDVDKNNEYYCSIDGNLYTKDLKTLVRYAMGKNDTSFEIPQGVETIGNYAISYCRALTNVVISNSVTSIGYDAFCGCNALISVVIPDSVTSIGDCAFYLCDALTSIDVDKNNEYYCSIDGNLYTKDLKTLVQYAIGKTDTSFEIPQGIETIGNHAFSYCRALTSVFIPDSVTTIGYYAFRNCSSLTIYAEATSQPSGWSSSWNSSNRPVVWGHTHTYEDYICVCGMEQSYIEKWDISATENDNVTATLYDDYSLVISGTGEMKNWRWEEAPWNSSYCSEIKSVTIENGVTSIGSFAFYGCITLASATIADSVTVINNHAFSDCTGLQDIEISNGIKVISYSAFRDCVSLKTVIIPEGVNRLEESVFRDCTGLETIVIPNSVNYIGEYLFSGCTSLSSVEISNCVTSIDRYLFSGCTSLSSVEIPNSVISIGKESFSGCTSLLNIEIPSSVTSLGDYLFSGCSSLKTVIIGDGVTEINNGTFYNCKNLERIALGKNVNRINSGDTFLYCTSLTNIEVAEGNTRYKSIDGNLYLVSQIPQDASATLVQYAIGKPETTFAIPYNVDMIGMSAFATCNTLKSISIHSGVSNVGAYVFADCSNLTIYAEVEESDCHWNSNWNYSNRPVVWDYKNTIRGQVFTFKGYSFNEAGSMAVGFDIDYEAKALYEELTGETLEIGVVFAGYSLLNGNQPLDSQGNAVTLPDGAVVKFDLTEYDYTYYDFVITDIIDGIKDIPLVISAYINNGAENKYIQENGISDTVSGISYNEANRK